jgi:hypothetical protein
MFPELFQNSEIPYGLVALVATVSLSIAALIKFNGADYYAVEHLSAE